MAALGQVNKYYEELSNAITSGQGMLQHALLPLLTAHQHASLAKQQRMLSVI
jgi:hypothetical protein